MTAVQLAADRAIDAGSRRGPRARKARGEARWTTCLKGQ